MKFLVESIKGARNASLEERATICNLRIMVDKTNSCFHMNVQAGKHFDSVLVPSVYLAEGIATDWWAIFGSRDGKHPIWPYRTGFVLPFVSFSCDGPTFEVSCEQRKCDNPDLRFTLEGVELISRIQAEDAFAEFIQNVIAQLNSCEIAESEVSLQWSRVLTSRQDPEERSFCEAAGALGANPYAIDEAESEFIENAGNFFEEDALNEFLTGVSKLNSCERNETLFEAIKAEKGADAGSRLPDLREAANQIKGVWRRRSPGERAWAPGYRCARAFRDVIGISSEENLASVGTIAERLGSNSFGCEDGFSRILAMVSRHEDIHVHLRRITHQGGSASENFHFARAIGDAVCFPDGGHSVVNGLQGAERQAMGRAFAAEFLAPSQLVSEMVDHGLDSEEIARNFTVSPEVIERQIENQGRIYEACNQ